MSDTTPLPPSGKSNMLAHMWEQLAADREAINALTALVQTLWHRQGPVPIDRATFDAFVDELPEREAVALNASLGQSYGTRPEFAWDGPDPIARAVAADSDIDRDPFAPLPITPTLEAAVDRAVSGVSVHDTRPESEDL